MPSCYYIQNAERIYSKRVDTFGKKCPPKIGVRLRQVESVVFACEWDHDEVIEVLDVLQVVCFSL